MCNDRIMQNAQPYFSHGKVARSSFFTCNVLRHVQFHFKHIIEVVIQVLDELLAQCCIVHDWHIGQSGVVVELSRLFRMHPLVVLKYLSSGQPPASDCKCSLEPITKRLFVQVTYFKVKALEKWWIITKAIAQPLQVYSHQYAARIAMNTCRVRIEPRHPTIILA